MQKLFCFSIISRRLEILTSSSVTVYVKRSFVLPSSDLAQHCQCARNRFSDLDGGKMIRIQAWLTSIWVTDRESFAHRDRTLRPTWKITNQENSKSKLKCLTLKHRFLACYFDRLLQWQVFRQDAWYGNSNLNVRHCLSINEILHYH